MGLDGGMAGLAVPQPGTATATQRPAAEGGSSPEGEEAGLPRSRSRGRTLDHDAVSDVRAADGAQIVIQDDPPTCTGAMSSIPIQRAVQSCGRLILPEGSTPDEAAQETLPIGPPTTAQKDRPVAVSHTLAEPHHSDAPPLSGQLLTPHGACDGLRELDPRRGHPHQDDLDGEASLANAPRDSDPAARPTRPPSSIRATSAPPDDMHASVPTGLPPSGGMRDGQRATHSPAADLPCSRSRSRSAPPAHLPGTTRSSVGAGRLDTVSPGNGRDAAHAPALEDDPTPAPPHVPRSRSRSGPRGGG